MADCPFFDLSVEDQKAWIEKEYKELQVVHQDNISFAGKTASMIAYERMLESKMPDGLFNDHLAQYLAEPYGKRVSQVAGLGLQKFFDPEGEHGFRHNGHVHFTPARTQLINDHMGNWISVTSGAKQVVELGSGYSTRPFWVETLKGIKTYFEVDTYPINDFKTKVFKNLDSQGLLTPSFCERKTVDIDFLLSSVKDLIGYGFSDEIPTCWILEGIVMYLGEEKSSALLSDVADLSVAGSFMILNFFVGNSAADPDSMESLLETKGWKKVQRLYFGDEGFQYGKYPIGKSANKFFGFSFLRKV